MGKEDTPLQHDMFSGELVDTRTRRQKQQDRDRQQPKQMEMFSQREVAQFGVKAHPLLPLSSNTRLLLIPEDPRTEEEIEADRQREAQKRTFQMFKGNRSGNENTQPEKSVPNIESDTQTLALVPRGVVALVVIDHWARLHPL